MSYTEQANKRYHCRRLTWLVTRNYLPPSCLWFQHGKFFSLHLVCSFNQIASLPPSCLWFQPDRFSPSILFVVSTRLLLSLHLGCSFVRLADYLIVNTMHILVVNSVAGLLAVLQEQISRTPTHAVIHSWADPDAGAAVPDARSNIVAASDDTNKKVPLWRFKNRLQIGRAHV